MTKSTYKLALAILVAAPMTAFAQDMGPPQRANMPAGTTAPFRADRSSDIPAAAALSDRVTYTALSSQQGTTVPIQMADIVRLCADRDGCTMRLAMFNWDGTGRVASREYLFFYNPSTRGWRASNDAQGFDVNLSVEHVQQVWGCYFTDGEYSNFNGTDAAAGLNLLNWNEFSIDDCWLTIIE